jgi:cytochrome b561
VIATIRAWALRHTAERRYSPVGQIFHWTMAALISFQLYWGWSISMMPVGGDKLNAYRVHAEIGLLMFVLAALRAIWRLIVPGPVNDADNLGWQTWAAHVTHILFYICFFGLPLSGWAMWSALGDGSPLSVAGVIPWPQMPFETLATPIQWLLLDWSESIHVALILLLIVMIPIHVGAALKHHFWDRHDVLLGMLPELPDDEGRKDPPRSAKLRRSRPRIAGG